MRQQNDADKNTSPRWGIKAPVAKGCDINPAIAELAKTKRWVCWRAEPRKGSNKVDKVPYTTGRRKASSTDPATWDTFEACHRVAFVEGKADGIGIVLDGSDGLVAFDFDDCINEEQGELTAWAEGIVKRLNSYTEVTPSGTGVHVLCRGEIPVNGTKRGNNECYRTKRFMTVTGQHLVAFPNAIKRRGKTVPGVFTELFGAEHSRSIRANGLDEDAELPGPLPEEVVKHEFRLFRRLNAERDYPSPSELDLALVHHLRRQRWSREEAAAFIRTFRGMQDDPKDRSKGERRNYVWPTVGKVYEARQPSKEPKLIHMSEWCNTFKPPKYGIKGLWQQGYLYTATARTGHGKTAVFLRIAVHKALGEKLGGRTVYQGNVVYLAGENPDDVKYRCILMTDWLGLDPEKLPLHFVEGTFDFDETHGKLRDQVEAIGGASTIIADTGPAFQAAWGFDNDNDNMQALSFGLKMREFTQLPGNPTVLVLTQPVKYATRENLFPRGGGALLNHVDGNFTLWAEGDRALTEMWWAGKFRGPTFEPLTFKLITATCDKLQDTEGNLIPSVYANYINPTQTADAVHQRAADDEAVLTATFDAPRGSLSDLAVALEWTYTSGRPAKSRVQRAVERLRERKLIQREGNTWVLTKEGRTAAGKAAKEDAEND